ncbi:hypothetical protein BBO_05492 [Beauveria brongniartii RCEF 3172]|uniref:BZIP domain-containing protein n=1 Tax=Beauveria brongniartii RCEF 3172 TaxID=1081107 RepID=A0A167CS17_9HYPO|nr:hypothetical protein BBO_05492 [Beauveria brongniartii RCEF 3172]
MSTPAQKANLARIRDNQRRSRARRREYLQELEQRLRLCELQGIEATAEVQIAARRVADENRQLRQLLNEHGFSEEYINRFLQAGNAVAGPGMNHRQAFATGEPSMASHALQQAMVSRRPASLESNVPFSVTSQVMSDSSISSTPSVSTSNPWDAMPAESSYGHNPGMHLQTTSLASQSSQQQQQQQQQQYPAAIFMANQTRGPEAYLNQSAHLGSLASTPGIAQTMQQQQQHGRGHMHYDGPMNNYQTEDDSSYGDGSTGGWPG